MYKRQVEEKEKEVYVLFEDHGQGIENIEIEKIFNRSYTLSDTNKNYEMCIRDSPYKEEIEWLLK